MNETTLLVVQLTGPVLLAMGAGFLLNPKMYAKVYSGFSKNPFSVLIAGMLSMVMGLLIVMNHNLWSTPLEVIVSILGWGALVKGAAFMVIPPFYEKMGKIFLNKPFYTVVSLISIVLGGYLSWVGFFA